MKQVSQLDENGFLVGVVVADESPLEPGVFLIPSDCVDMLAPNLQNDQRARWTGNTWEVERMPEPETLVVTYAQKRASEYPPMTDYLDAVVKGDQAQIDAYIAACQAVKSKYPKPDA